MADDQRVMEKASAPLPATGTGAAAAGTQPAVVEGAAAAERSVPPKPSAVGSSLAEPRTRDEARQAISRTRDRISSTLDEIEVRLREKKAELRGKTDINARVRGAVRGREVPALAAAVGIGLLAAFLLGGRGDRREVVLTREELEALRRWRQDRERVMETMERAARALEDLAED